jgi:glyoxylase-like metal-dependent hydrolase (beta-lactamase superfamily II)
MRMSMAHPGLMNNSEVAMRTLAITAVSLASLVTASAGCSASSHATRPAELGAASRSASLLEVIDRPGPIELTSINSSDWAVDRSGLINLSHPTARAAGLHDQLEPIQIYFHALRHPQKGLFIVDTGMERAMRDAPEKAAIQGLVARYMKTDRLKVVMPLGDWLAAQKTPLAGVLLTHIHMDHVSGMPDVPHGTPIYTGPGETRDRAFTNLFVRPNLDRALAGQAPLGEWRFQPDADGRFAGVLDVFGDGSLWAIHVPGHTPGSTAYLARTTRGPVLLVGDTCHTSWGWKHDVEPGSFTSDQRKNADSLARLRKLVAEHPAIQVRLGHQRLE